MHDDARIKYKCDVCGKVCNVHGNLMKHKRKMHENPTKYKCHICNKEFKYSSNVKHQSLSMKRKSCLIVKFVDLNLLPKEI